MIIQKNTHKPIIYGAMSLLALLATLFFISKATDTQPASQARHWQHGWQFTRSFTIARRALAAVASNHHIYVIGGMDSDDRYITEVEYAEIQPDGALGPWRFTTALKTGRFYLSAVVVGRYIYVIGGANGSRGSDNVPSASVERAEIYSDGQLGPWVAQPYMTTPRRGLRAVTRENWIYAIGGYNGAFLKTTERASLGKNGNLSSWQRLPAESVVDRYIHSAAAYGGFIYLLAGHVEKADTMSYGDVESSRIGTDGALQPWRIEATSLQTPRFIAAATALNGYLYLIGGHNGANRLVSVESARIKQSGKIGAWTAATPLNTARSATATVTHKNRLYVLGGGGGDPSSALNSVETAQQGLNGQLGWYIPLGP